MVWLGGIGGIGGMKSYVFHFVPGRDCGGRGLRRHLVEEQWGALLGSNEEEKIQDLSRKKSRGDAGGNKKLADVGPWLRDQILSYAKRRQRGAM